MRYLALALAFASVIIPLNSPQGSKPKTPRSLREKNLNIPNPSDITKGSDLTNTKKTYQSELNDRDMITFFVSFVFAFKIFKNRHQFIPQFQPKIPMPSDLVSAITATSIVTAAAAYKAPQLTNIANNNNPNPNSIKLLISKEKKPELSGPSR